MSAHVWDASAALKLISDEPGSPEARWAYKTQPRNLVLDWTSVELASALCKRVARSGADAVSALEAFAAWEHLAFETERAGELASVALRLALEHRHTVYDCAYVALALAEGATLVTADARQRDVAETAGVEVRWIDSSR